MIDVKQQAPGCFAAASVYSMDSDFCKQCVAYKECGDAAMQTLQEIRATIDVSDILKRHAAARKKAQSVEKPAASQPLAQSPIPVMQPKAITKPVERKTTVARVTFEISETDQTAIARLSVKAKEHAIVLCKHNKIEEMRVALPKGVNPFAQSGPKFLRIACDLLIGGGLTKASFKAKMMEELAWSDGTAGSHVALTLPMLHTFGIIVGKDGQFVLNPAIAVQN